MNKPKVYKIEAYQRDKGWSVTIIRYGGASDSQYCFSTTKQMIKFISKIA